MNKYRFIGKRSYYNIPHNEVVDIVKFYPKRKALVVFEGMQYLTMTTLLRKI